MGVYWNNNGKNGNSTIDIEDSFIISYVKKWIYSKGDTLMNADVEFLNYVYQNSQMGIDTLEQLLEITEDRKIADISGKSRLRAIGSFITKPGIF